MPPTDTTIHNVKPTEKTRKLFGGGACIWKSPSEGAGGSAPCKVSIRVDVYAMTGTGE